MSTDECQDSEIHQKVLNFGAFLSTHGARIQALGSMYMSRQQLGCMQTKMRGERV